MLENKIDELIVALNENTAALAASKQGCGGSGRTAEEIKASIAKQEQEMHNGQDTTATETPKKVAKKKASKKKAKKVEPAAEPQAQADPVVDAPLDAAKVQTHLRGIASQLTDTSKLFALIQKHGGQQFSDLDPSVYVDLIADAEQLVVDGV